MVYHLAYFNVKFVDMVIFEGQIINDRFKDPKIHKIILKDMGRIFYNKNEFLKDLLDRNYYKEQIMNYINDPENEANYNLINLHAKKDLHMYIEFLENLEAGNVAIKYKSERDTDDPFVYKIYSEGMENINLPFNFNIVYDQQGGREMYFRFDEFDEHFFRQNIWYKRKLISKYNQYLPDEEIDSLDVQFNSLDLSNMGMTVFEVEKIDKIETLLYLNLSNNELEELKYLEKIVNLQTLNLSSNYFETLSESIFELRHLEELDISFNPVQSVTQKLSLLPKLNKVNFKGINRRAFSYDTIESLRKMKEKGCEILGYDIY